jgi:hypothetical protein
MNPMIANAGKAKITLERSGQNINEMKPTVDQTMEKERTGFTANASTELKVEKPAEGILEKKEPNVFKIDFRVWY